MGLLGPMIRLRLGRCLMWGGVLFVALGIAILFFDPLGQAVLFLVKLTGFYELDWGIYSGCSAPSVSDVERTVTRTVGFGLIFLGLVGFLLGKRLQRGIIESESR